MDELDNKFSSYPKDYFGANHILHKFVGNYVPRKTEPRKKRKLFITYNIIVCSMVLLYVPFEVMELPHSAKNIIDLVEQMGIFLSHILLFIKLLIWFVRHDQILDIMDALDSDDYKYEDYKDFKPGEVISRHKWIFLMFFRSFFTIGVLVPFSKFAEAFYNYSKKKDLIDGVTLRCQGVLPYYVNFPHDMENPKGCFVSFFLQALPLFTITLQIIGYDMIFLNLCIYLRGHLIVVQSAFRTIRERCLHNLNLPDDYDDENEALNVEMSRELRRITVHLQKIISLCEEMEAVFTVVSFSQTVITVMVMVSCLFVMSIEPLFSAAFTAQLDYCLAVYMQLGFYCIFGNEITSQSDLITTAIYESNWISTSKSFKTSMLINMTRMKQPLILTVGKFAPLTLALLIQVLKGSYSYFTVLKQRA